jgi:SAM-dependent methyltransferase
LKQILYENVIKDRREDMAIFDSIAMEYSFWIDRINPPHYPQMLDRFLPERLEHSLDAGCGPGHLSLYLSDCARQVLAIDISRSMLALAKDRMAQQRRTNIDFLCTDLNDLPLLPASFDFVGSDCVQPLSFACGRGVKPI